jgi:hypothetical protein
VQASRTLSALAPSRRAASEAVKPGGMCWTSSPPAPSGAGRAGSSSPRARGPPVEEAMTTIGPVAVRRAAVAGRGRRVARAAGGVAGDVAGAALAAERALGAELSGAAAGERRGARRPRPERAASATLRASSDEKPSSESPKPGLATRSKAPSASASTARAP